MTSSGADGGGAVQGTDLPQLWKPGGGPEVCRSPSSLSGFQSGTPLSVRRRRLPAVCSEYCVLCYRNWAVSANARCCCVPKCREGKKGTPQPWSLRIAFLQEALIRALSFAAPYLQGNMTLNVPFSTASI